MDTHMNTLYQISTIIDIIAAIIIAIARYRRWCVPWAESYNLQPTQAHRRDPTVGFFVL